MKKAYVKPVFLAEEFVLSDNVVAACGISVNTSMPLYFDENTHMCFNTKSGGSDSGHQASKGDLDLSYDGTMSYWEYAREDKSTSVYQDGNGQDVTFNNANAYLFSSSYTTCDFVWPNDQKNDKYVYVWNSCDVSLRTTLKSVGQLFADFFFNNNAGEGNHTPGYEGRALMS